MMIPTFFLPTLPSPLSQREKQVLPISRVPGGRAGPWLLALLCLWVVGVPRVVARVKVSRTDAGEESAVIVTNRHYRLEISPARGATISSLRFGRVQKGESTAWDPRSRSGLVQEVQTADVPFDLFRERRTGERLELGYRGSAGPLTVSKIFEFRANSPVIGLSLRFENHSDARLFGYDAPALTSLAAPAGQEAPGTRYYCFDDGSVPRVLSSATVLGELNQPLGGSRELRWLAATDPATRRGLGFIFPDRAARGVAVQRNRKGRLLARWSYPALPPWRALETSLMIVPLEGFAAVSELNKRFAADTVAAWDAEGAARVRVRLMPLEQKMQEVSVVTRAYGTDGQELQPCEPILYEDVPAWSTVADGIELPAQDQKRAWLVHEVYSRGEKLGRFLGRVAGGPNRPRIERTSPPDPQFEPLDSEPPVQPLVPTASEQGRGFLLCAQGTRRQRRLAEPISLLLFSGEWETLFVGFRALRDVQTLRASLTAGAGGSSAAPLPAAAGYLWSVSGEDGLATLSPFGDRPVAKDEVQWLAVTLDASQLETGDYAGRLHVDADGESAEVSLQIGVVAANPGPHGGFALWHIGDPGEERRMSLLADRGVSAATVAAPFDGRAGTARALLREGGRFGLGLPGFLAPGRGAAVAEQLGPAVARTGLFPAGPPTWLLWENADSSEAPERLRELGFSVAVLADRLSGLKGNPLWRRAGADHWLVQNGCQPGTVRELISAGWVRPHDGVWAAVDLRGSTWADAAHRLREIFWAGAWQGLSGAAVRLPTGPDGPDAPDAQLALWHVLRDAREEAAACAMMLERAAKLSTQSGGEEATAVRRARLLAEVDELIGRDPGDLIGIESRGSAYRELIRARPSEGTGGTFRVVRNRAVALVEEMDRLLPSPAITENLYWRGMALVRGDAMRWAIWSPDAPRPGSRAESLWESVRKRTGWELARLKEYPPARDLSLLWVFVENDLGELPGRVISAARSMGDGEVRVLSLDDGPAAVVVGREIPRQALRGSLLPRPTLYRPARGIR